VLGSKGGELLVRRPNLRARSRQLPVGDQAASPTDVAEYFFRHVQRRGGGIWRRNRRGG
jgi:hypothetical protein